MLPVVEASKAALCSREGVGSKSLLDGRGCRVVAAAIHPFDHQSAHSTDAASGGCSHSWVASGWFGGRLAVVLMPVFVCGVGGV